MITLTANLIGCRRRAQFSECMKFRYLLEIIWDDIRKPQMVIGLNGSTATQLEDDPTVRRCIDYAHRWGAGGLCMANACAFRATDPKVMLAYDGDPVGPENTVKYLEGIAATCQNRPIAAWGKHANDVKNILWTRGRGAFLKNMMGPLDCLRLNKDGSPAHPLYLPANLTPIPFNYTRAE